MLGITACSSAAPGEHLVGHHMIGVGAIGWQAANKAGNEAAAAQQMDNIRKYEAQYAGLLFISTRKRKKTSRNFAAN